MAAAKTDGEKRESSRALINSQQILGTRSMGHDRFPWLALCRLGPAIGSNRCLPGLVSSQ